MLYPSHIAPQVELSTRRIISDLVDDFIRPGSIDDIAAPHLRYLKASIEGIAIPFGIARKRENGYDLSFDINKVPLLARIVNMLPQKNSQANQDHNAANLVSYESVYKQLRKSEHGIIVPIFELMIAALMRKGQITGYKSGIQVSISSVGFPMSNYVQHLERGQIIDSELRRQLAYISEAMLGIKLQDYDVEKQEEIWSKLCQLKEDVSRNIIASRQALQLLIDRLSSAVDMPDIMDSLAKTQSLLAEIRPTLSSKDGIEHFLKMIPSRLSDQDDIRRLIGRSESVRVFVNEEIQDLFNIWNYINSSSLIIPDSDRYSELRSLRDEARKLLKIDEKFIFDEGMDKLREAFRHFRDSFITVYASEHKIANDRTETNNFAQARNSTDYQILSQFAKISIISVPNDLNRVNRLIDTDFKPSCNRIVHEQLEQFPICACGFRLGTEIKSAGKESSDISGILESGIRQYLTALQEPVYGDQIEDYISKMRQLDQSVPQRELDKLVNLDPDLPIDDLRDELSRVLTPIAIQHINRALGSNIVIIKRNISQLHHDLVDKKYPKAKVRDIVNKWIEGSDNPSDDVYIMIEE